jgi:hypothetical protein
MNGCEGGGKGGTAGERVSCDSNTFKEPLKRFSPWRLEVSTFNFHNSWELHVLFTSFQKRERNCRRKRVMLACRALRTTGQYPDDPLIGLIQITEKQFEVDMENPGHSIHHLPPPTRLAQVGCRDLTAFRRSGTRETKTERTAHELALNNSPHLVAR